MLLTYWNGQPDFVKVTDFGVARLVGEQRLTVVGGIVGTPAFISPEMLSGRDVGPAADMYAVGIMLHDLIVGSPPFSGTMRTVLNSHLTDSPPLMSKRRPGADIPKALDELVARLVSKAPEARPTAEEATNLLMQLRPSLPPRSVRSVLVAETLVLANRAQRGSLYDADTLLLSPDRPDLLRTLELPPLLREVDRIDFELERSSQQLYRLCMALIGRRWPRRPPTELLQQCRLLHDCGKAEEELGLQLALLTDRAETAEQEAVARRAEIHGRMMAVREELSERAPRGKTQQRRLHESILTLERAYADVKVDPSAARELSQHRPRMQKLRGELQRGRRELAGRVLKRCAQDLKDLKDPKLRDDATMKAACLALDKALRDFDHLASAMTVLLHRFPILERPA
ncbi:MAG TPA: protein kinase [Pseudomonadota bacterium]|nr:protein kinase [Pseudomonadota bacterium]